MIRVVTFAVLLVLAAGSAFAQEESGLLVQNPLDEIRDALAGTLDDAGMPFTEDQVQAIALAMDEQRRATEELFGQVLDFSAGPPQGDQLDQALAGIAWMSEAFLENVDDVLTPEQDEVWMSARLEGTVPQSARLDGGNDSEGGSGREGAGSSEQIAQIRINNNPFTAETLGRNRGGFGGGGFGGDWDRNRRGGGNEVITRGGVGDYHGNLNFTFQNHHLNGAERVRREQARLRSAQPRCRLQRPRALEPVDDRLHGQSEQ